jgi:tRNA dimethylallyltransferase
MKRVVAIVGPTGVGKSALALRLAQDLNGEIVTADSRQIYRYMDIGTAKPSPEEQALVPHHLIDIVDPDEAFYLARYLDLGYKTINEILARDSIPIVAGGSGLYVWALLEGWQIPKVVPDFTFRKHLEERAARGEGENLFEELKHLDPEAAGRIDPRNVRRVIRALEISKNPNLDSRPAKIKPQFEELIVGLTAKRETLYSRIDERVDSMVERGLVDEVRGLMNRGYATELPSMSGIGYRQVSKFLKGTISLEEAIQQVKNESHRLVRMQYNWFSPKDDRIHWFDVDTEPFTEIRTLVTGFMKA